MSTTADDLRAEVRRRYADAALAALAGDRGSCGGGDCCTTDFGSGLYSEADRDDLPAAASLASLGCGNPTAVADLREGETVLDLGSGGGIDVILSARRVGQSGRAFGLDMTDEMLALARRNAEEAGVANAIFLRGRIEDVPLPAASVDVVISNCVINLSTDKGSVLAEIGRVLKPGGRLGVSDVVAEDRLTPAERAERGSYVGCIAGALSRSEYEAGLEAAGFDDVSVEFTHEVADGMHGAIVKAVKTAQPGAAGPAGRGAGRAGRLLLMNVLFVCVGNQGRSVMAERLFRERAAGRHDARSAGSAPGNEVHGGVLEALAEIGIDAGDHVPRRLDEQAIRWADVVVATCDDACPVIPGKRYVAWQLDDPMGLPVEQVRPLRDDIAGRVEALAAELDGEPARPGA